MKNEKYQAWLKFGAAFLVITAIGHLVFVDISLNFFENTIVTVSPSSILADLNGTTFDWGIFGSNSARRVYFGFSIWISISLAVIAFWSLASASEPARAKTAAAVCGFSAATFSVIAYFCFITPPVVGGACATFCYAYSYHLAARGS